MFSLLCKVIDRGCEWKPPLRQGFLFVHGGFGGPLVCGSLSRGAVHAPVCQSPAGSVVSVAAGPAVSLAGDWMMIDEDLERFRVDRMQMGTGFVGLVYCDESGAGWWAVLCGPRGDKPLASWGQTMPSGCGQAGRDEMLERLSRLHDRCVADLIDGLESSPYWRGLQVFTIAEGA